MILSLKFRDSKSEQELEFLSLDEVEKHLKGLREEDLEYVILEFNDGSSVPESTYAEVLNYCEFWKDL